MSSTMTKRTRDLRERSEAIAKTRDLLLRCVDEWAEAVYLRDRLPRGDVRRLPAETQVRMAESELLKIHGRNQAWL